MTIIGACRFAAQAQKPEPAGWFAGDMHVHRSCGGTPVSLSSIRSQMSTHDLAIVSLLADMGNGEVRTPSTDLPKVNGNNDPISTSSRIVHWDAEWHWDANYYQFPHQALGGHIVALGLTNAYQIWEEYTYPIFQWARRQGGVAGFAHMQYLDDAFPQSLNCCIPIEYPVEVALGSCDFISEDVAGSDTAMRAYYRLLNCGFRPAFAAGSDYPCNAAMGALLTYVRVSGSLTYRKWVDGLDAGRTVVSRNGHNEFLDLKVNGTAQPGDEIALATSGTVTVTVQWTANQSLSGTMELVHNGNVVASRAASVTATSPQSLSATVDIPRSGWLAARRMGGNGHAVHTGAVFVKVNNAPVRASAADAQFYVQWMDNLLQRTSPGGAWASYFVTNRAAAQARYQSARSLYQQIALEASGPQPLAITTTALPGGVLNVPYAQSVSASGGTAPYAWALTAGALPPGLSLNSSSGLISGNPTSTGTYNFTARVTDASSPVQTATKALSLTINAAAAPGFVGNAAEGTQSDEIWSGGAWINAGRFLAASNMTVATMRAKVAGISGKYKCAIYGDSGALPGTLLGSTLEVTNPSTAWHTFALTTPLVLNAGSYYWLAIWSDNAGARVYYSGTGGTLRWGRYDYGTWPSPLSTSGGGTLNYCINAVGAAGTTLTSIAVTPSGPTITAGATQQFTATGVYSDGTTQNLTSTAAWTSSNTNVATISPGGLATGRSGGTATLSAVFSGITGGTVLTVQALDTTRPTVVTVVPAAGAAGVSVNAVVQATFSEPMAAGSVNTNTMVLRTSQGIALPGVVTYDAELRRATLTPSSPLQLATAYTGVVLGGASGVKDVAGNPLATDYSWTFTTVVPDTTPPVIVAVTPSSGATNVSPATVITATFNEPMNGTTINSNTMVLLDSAGQPVPAAVTYVGSNFSGVLTPASSLRPLEIYTAGVAGGVDGVRDAAGNRMISDFAWLFTTANQARYSFWEASVIPATLSDSDTVAVELGLKFKSAVPGYVTAIRFYKSTGNTGQHVGSVWSRGGVKLASTIFVNETASGWQEQALPSPLFISANTTYVVSYHAPNGRYSSNAGFFTAGVDKGPLRALANGEDGGNGVYRYGATAFPNQTWNASHYWVDLVFQPQP